MSVGPDDEEVLEIFSDFSSQRKERGDQAQNRDKGSGDGDASDLPHVTIVSPIEVFCCYAHKDQELLQELKKHLLPLQRQGLISVWNDTDISPGMNYEEEINKHLSSSGIILLLISPDFMASDYCYSKEMERAMEQHASGKSRVIPVILRSIYWQTAPFGTLEALPLDGKPVVHPFWHNLDEAFFNVAEGIRKAAALFMKGNAIESIPQSEKSVTGYSSNSYMNSLSLSNNLGTLLEKAIRELECITHTDYNQIFLITTSTHARQLTAVADVIAPQKRSYRIVALSGLLGLAYLKKRTIYVRNTQEMPDYFRAVKETRSELVVPIFTKDLTLGVLNSESEEIAYYDDEMQIIVEQLAKAFGELLPILGWHSNFSTDTAPWVRKLPKSMS